MMRKHVQRYQVLLTICSSLLFRADRPNETKFLIANGANVNDTNKRGYSPLHWAALHGELFSIFSTQFIRA